MIIIKCLAYEKASQKHRTSYLKFYGCEAIGIEEQDMLRDMILNITLDQNIVTSMRNDNEIVINGDVNLIHILIDQFKNYKPSGLFKSNDKVFIIIFAILMQCEFIKLIKHVGDQTDITNPLHLDTVVLCY